MRNGILLNHLDKINYISVLLKNGYADFELNADTYMLYSDYYGDKEQAQAEVLSKIYLYDDIFLVKPEDCIHFRESVLDLRVSLISENPLKGFDRNYMEYIQPMVMQALVKHFSIPKGHRFISLLEEQYALFLENGAWSFDARSLMLDAKDDDMYALAERIMRPKIGKGGTDSFIWQLFCDYMFDRTLEYVDELILNIEYSAMKDLVICGSHIDYSDFYYKDTENASYKIIKLAIEQEHQLQPSFSCLDEMLAFKDKNRICIGSLRSEISSLERELRDFSSEAALQKAIKDVNNAKKALSSNSKLKSVSKATTYISIPVAILDEILGTKVGVFITVAGGISTMLCDYNVCRNDWVNIVY